MPGFPERPELPPLPADGTTGDDFNDQAIEFFQGLRDEYGPWLEELGEAFANYVSSVLTASSATSLAIGTGSKAFTIGDGFAFVAGQRVRASSLANVANYMEGAVASYTGGVLTVTVDDTGGSGTKNDWQIGLVVDGDLGAKLDADGGTASDLTVTGYTETPVDPAAGSSFSPSLSAGTVLNYDTNANATITLPTAVAGKSFALEVTFGGAHTLAFAGATVKWAGGSPPDPTSTTGAVDGYAFSCFEDGVWTGYDGGRDIS